MHTRADTRGFHRYGWLWAAMPAGAWAMREGPRVVRCTDFGGCGVAAASYRPALSMSGIHLLFLRSLPSPFVLLATERCRLCSHRIAP